MARRAKRKAKPKQERCVIDGPMDVAPGVSLTQIDGDLLRLDHPEWHEILFVDARTEWGRLGGAGELLGAKRFKDLQRDFGPCFKLHEVKAWLIEQGFTCEGMNWSTFFALRRRRHTRDEEWSKPMSKGTIATALRLQNAYALTKAAEAGVYKLRPAGNRQRWQIRLNGLPAEARKKLA